MESRRKISEAHKGKKFSEFQRQRLREGWVSRKAKGLGVAWNKGTKGVMKPNGGSFYEGFKHAESTRVKFSQRKGAMSSNWKGGVTPVNLLLRTSSEYKMWRKAVFERDNYTCKFCEKRGGELNADHIQPFAFFPELRFVVDNGRTLCKPCHTLTPTYRNRKPLSYQNNNQLTLVAN